MTDVSSKDCTLKNCKMSHKNRIIPFKEWKLGSDFSTLRIIEEKLRTQARSNVQNEDKVKQRLEQREKEKAEQKAKEKAKK